MTKKIISFLLTVSMILSLAVIPAYAAENLTAQDVAEEAGFLKSLGILDAVPSEEEGNKEVTRAEFVIYAARVLGVQNRNENTRYFMDVPMDHWALTYINQLTEMNVLSMPEDKLFKPNDKITVNEVVKILVSLCGYGDYAKVSGGYPKGYTDVARRLEIPVPGGDNPISLYNYIIMLYEALRAPLYEIRPADDTRVSYVESDETLLSKYYDIYETSGIVTQSGGIGVYDAPATGKTSADTAAIVKIGDDRYSSDVNLIDYLGRYTTVFYKQVNEDDIPHIVYRTDYKREDNVIEFDIKDFGKYENGVLTYYTESGKAQSETIPAGAFIIKNGKNETGNNVDVFNLKKGNVRLVDTENDGNIDFVFIWEYTNVFVSIIDAANFIIYDKVVPDKTVLLDDTEKIVMIENASGAKKTFADIAKSQLLTVYESDSYVRVIINGDGVSSNIYSSANDEYGLKLQVGKSETDKRWLYVDGDYQTDYLSDANYNGEINLNPGSSITYYLDAAGNIAYVTGPTGDGWTYGYLIKPLYDTDVEGSKLKLYTQSKKVMVYDVSDKVRVDAVRADTHDKLINALNKNNYGKTLTTGEDPVNGQLIRFKLNKDGVVSEIDTENYNAAGEDRISLHRTQDVASRTFWYHANGFANGKLLYNSSTVQFVVPTHANLPNCEDDDFRIITTYESGSHRVEGFKLDLQAGNESAIVCYASTDDIESTGPFLVESVNQSVNDDGEVVKTAKVYRATGGDLVTITADSDDAFSYTDSTTKTDYQIEKGDFIYAKVGYNGNVVSITMLYDYSRQKDQDAPIGWKNGRTAPRQSDKTDLVCAYVKNYSNSVARLVYSRKLTADDYDYTKSDYTYCDWPTRVQTGTVLVFDGKEITKSTLANEIVPGNAIGPDDAYAYWFLVSYTKIKAAVVYKNN